MKADRPPLRAPAIPPAAQVAALRHGTEAVFERTLTTMFDAMDNLSRAEAALLALSDRFAPPELARLRGLQARFEALARAVEATVARLREAARRLEGLMRGGRGRLDDLRRLARSGSLVALNAQVVSGAIRADDGHLDALARTMRAVLAEVEVLVAGLAGGIDRGQDDLRRVARGAADLQALADREAVPAIDRFAALIEGRARDRALARSAGLVSGRLAGLQGRIRGVVTHLQVGDGFRQRLEHVEAILDGAARMADAPGPVPPGLLEELAARQIRGALTDLRRALQEGRRGLRALGRTAGAVPAALEAGGFLGEGVGGLAPLVAGADRIERAIEGLGRAGLALADGSAALAHALGGVGEATRQAAEFETRMTVLGLNAILLSSRLGSEGRAMVEVAQQLRDIARGISELIALLRQDTDGIARTAGALDAPGDDGLAGHLAAAGEATQEVAALARVMRRELDALAASRPAAEIAEAFRRAERELEGFVASAGSLAALADRLGPPHAAPVDPARLPEGAAEVLAGVRRLYTMQGERAIHDALFPHLAAPPAPAESVEDDILFG